MNTRALLTAGAAAAGYAALWRLGTSWGATPEERREPLPGDELVADPTLVTTHAISIDAPPEAVWPWLVQMGWGRAGWYTYRWVDRLLFPANGPSATRIVPELQRLHVGDHILDGPPDTDCWFNVEMLDANRLLVLKSTTHLPRTWREGYGARLEWVWSWHLRVGASGSEPVGGYVSEPAPHHVRLIQRNRMRLRPRLLEAAFFGVIVPADFVMARSHLRAIRQRAEAAADQRLASNP